MECRCCEDMESREKRELAARILLDLASAHSKLANDKDCSDGIKEKIKELLREI